MMKWDRSRLMFAKRKSACLSSFASAECLMRNQKKEDDFIAECDACKELYHKRCLKIPDHVFKKSNSKYLCTTYTRARKARL